MKALLIKPFRISLLLDLSERLPAYSFHISILSVLDFNQDSHIRVVDPDHDVAEPVSGLPV